MSDEEYSSGEDYDCDDFKDDVGDDRDNEYSSGSEDEDKEGSTADSEVEQKDDEKGGEKRSHTYPSYPAYPQYPAYPPCCQGKASGGDVTANMIGLG